MIDMKLDNKPNRADAYKYSISSWRKWGEKNNCRLVLLEEPLVDPKEMSPTWQRYYLFELLENSGVEYDQILMVDSDTIVHPECPNFFELTEYKYCGVHNCGSYDWLFRSIENYSKLVFNGHEFSDWEKYINGGFQIVNKKHRSFFAMMIEFYNNNKDHLLNVQETFHVGTDQPALNFFLDIHKVDLKILPYEFNGQDLAMHESLTEDCLFWNFVWVAHFNAIPNNQESKVSNAWMEHAYKNVWGEL
jgi:lipopolysaccharide biosynthesis glycosyltransferase